MIHAASMNTTSKPFSVLIDAMRDSSLPPDRKAVIVLDEWGLSGTRLTLELLRRQKRA
jgi:hypothetical protein